MEKLARFVATYPKAEDSADALLELGMISEFQNKEPEAKKWYEQLVRTFPSAPQAIRGTGCLRRLNLEGQLWELNAPAVSLAGGPLTPQKLSGKMVIVYYWETRSPSVAADFARFKQLLEQYRGQVELVAVNLDENQGQAEAFLRQQGTPGFHLHAGGGLDSPAAQHYGLVVFPHAFLVGRDGKVVNRSLEISSLEPELKKLVK
jgi:thiol-disulfide isomerase/thioredoxin